MKQLFVLPLGSVQATLENAGGKGVNLARMVAAGLPVPGGFIITTEAYWRFVDDNDLQPFILATVKAAVVEDVEALEAASGAIRERFAAAVVPEEVAGVIREAYEAMEREAVAVRSSATAEDLPEMSFAGQQDTRLNVVGEDALLEAVVGCWSSLWTARAMAYRARNGIPQEDVALAVVVQRMVQSEAAGVLFTANPLTGRRDETVIDATVGLGEALVAGLVDPDQYVVDTRAVRIVSKVLGAKGMVVRGVEGGGTATIVESGEIAAAQGASRARGVGSESARAESSESASAEGTRQQALPDAAILELVALGQRAAALYEGVPQDVEWAWAEDQLHLLQTRVITSLYPLPDGMPARPLQVLFSLNHVQGMLDPFTPLGQDAILMAYVVLATLFGRRFSVETQREAVIAGERIYLNITPMVRHRRGRALAQGILGAVEPSAGQVMAHVLQDPALVVPDKDGLSPAALRGLGGFLSKVGPRAARALWEPDSTRLALQRQIDEFVAEIEGRAGMAKGLAERLALWQAVYKEFAARLSLQLFPPLMAGMGSFFQLRRLAIAELGSDQLALEVVRGLPHNATTQMDLALWTVAEVIRADLLSAQRFAAADGAELAAEFMAGRLPMAAQVALAAFMGRYGMRGLAEIDLGRPRWREELAHILDVVQSYLRIEDPELAPDAVFRRGAQGAEAAGEALVQAMPNPAKAHLARFWTSRVRALAGLRETPKFTIVRLMGVVREMVLQSGGELAAAGVVEQPDDLFFLHFTELQQLAAGVEGDWRGLVAKRRQMYRRELLRRQVPRVLLSDGRAYYDGLDAGAGDGIITGSPVSPGVAEGVVRVVFDPRDAQLAPGEILVCPGTDPSWTPLFLSAGGLVMEVGGLMTHGSVVAREYGIPAVVGVHEATRRLQTGRRVRVDGTRGAIEVLETE